MKRPFVNTHLFLILSLLITSLSVRSEEVATPAMPDTLTSSLVTCSPGSEIFELYGHEAIRIRGQIDNTPIDVIFNYGVFDFNAPNFVIRFVEGQTDYYVDAVPTDWFLDSYSAQRRTVVEQPLPITTAQSRQLLERLRTDLRPENCRYRYRYFSTNCSTRILDHIDSIAPELLAPMNAPASTQVSYRDLIRHYNEGYPWYQAGIDLALGKEIDRPLTVRQTMFVPMEITSHFQSPVTLVQGADDAREAPTPWYISPVFVSWVIFITFLALWCKGWLVRPLRCVWALLCGLTGMLLFFLIFFTVHEGVSPNLLAWWLNPVWILPAITLCSRSLDKFTHAVMTALGICTTTILIFWPLLPQSTNPAFFPLMGTTILICLPPLKAIMRK